MPGTTPHSLASATPFLPHWELYPKTYVAPRAPDRMLALLDGDLDKDVWKNAPFSDIFDDIRGPRDAPPDERPDGNCRTRFKAMWDDTHLFIGALIESDFTTEAHFTERNSPIFQKDSDFEVFIDPLGSCHNYKELEVNALNTVWNLMLDRPYNDDGAEYSGRVAKPGEKYYYEVSNQKSAVRLVQGSLNNPNEGATWSVEIAMSFDDILARINDSAASPPKAGTLWRINFSRVEKQGAINWTWQPQIVWTRDGWKGLVQMHLPDAWGYIAFVDSKDAPNPSISYRDPDWPARLAAMQVYYAQHAYKDDNGVFAASMDDLKVLTDPSIVSPFQISITLGPDRQTFGASIEGLPSGNIVQVTGDRKVVVVDASTLG